MKTSKFVSGLLRDPSSRAITFFITGISLVVFGQGLFIVGFDEAFGGGTSVLTLFLPIGLLMMMTGALMNFIATLMGIKLLATAGSNYRQMLSRWPMNVWWPLSLALTIFCLVIVLRGLLDY